MSVRSHHHDDGSITDEDSLSPFIINTVTRSISTTNKKMVLMQYDNKSERYTFEVDRKIDNHDLLDCNRVQIHFINIASTKQKHPGLYLVDDLKVMESDDNKVTFTWLISHDATQYAGILSFLVSFECVEEDNVLYRWSSSIYNSIQIATGMDNDNCIVEMYADELLAWQNSMETDVIPKMVDKCYIEREFATSEEVASVFDISNPDASSKVAVVSIKEITDYVDNAIANIEPTSNVTANPELDGTEDDLTGLTVNGTKYKLPMGGEYSAGNGLKLTDKEFSIDPDIVVQQTDLNKVLLSSTATEEVWIFPNKLQGFTTYGTSPTFEVNFISNKTKFSKIVVDRKYNDVQYLFYDSTTICTIHTIYPTYDWLADGYKTIALETPATGELLAFLQSAGAVKQGENGIPSKNTGDVGIIKQKTNDNFYPKTFVDCVYDDNGNSLNTLMPVANPTLDGTEADLDSLTINGTKYKIPAQSQITIDDTLSTTSENAIQNKVVTNEIDNIKTKLDNITVENNITTEDYIIEGQI